MDIYWKIVSRDKIAAMEAGPDLDRMVAERVMGWHIAPWEDETDGGLEWKDALGHYMAPYSSGQNPKWRWSPSTDIAAAWRVVEHITRVPRTVVEARQAANTAFAIWWDHANLWAHTASEAALAISRAALQAVMD